MTLLDYLLKGNGSRSKSYTRLTPSDVIIILLHLQSHPEQEVKLLAPAHHLHIKILRRFSLQQCWLHDMICCGIKSQHQQCDGNKRNTIGDTIHPPIMIGAKNRVFILLLIYISQILPDADCRFILRVELQNTTGVVWHETRALTTNRMLTMS